MVTARARLVCLASACLLQSVAPTPAPGAAPPPSGPPAERKNIKRTTVEVEEVERRFTRPAAPVAGANERRPEVGIDSFLRDRRQGSKRITDAQIAKMRALIAMADEDDPQKPDFFFRAGELYGENQRFYFGQAHALDQKIGSPDVRVGA